jgi:hypothetical protein
VRLCGPHRVVAVTALSLTDPCSSFPQCLLPLLNVPLLAWTLESLAASGVEQAILFVKDGVEEVRSWLKFVLPFPLDFPFLLADFPPFSSTGRKPSTAPKPSSRSSSAPRKPSLPVTSFASATPFPFSRRRTTSSFKLGTSETSTLSRRCSNSLRGGRRTRR